MNQQDQFLTQYTVWKDATEYLGTGEVELPSFEALTETIKGAGIAGEATAPVVGHYGSQTLKISWRTITKDAIVLSESKAHTIDFRANQQLFDTGKGEYVQQPVVIKTRCVPINFSPGKLAVGASTETANEFEVHYIKIMIDGKTIREFDKFNCVSIVNGKDELEQVRKNVGL